MKKNNQTLYYGLFALASLLTAMLGYVYTHKPFTAENLIGVLTAFWQTLIALFIIAVAGGIGEYFLKADNRHELERMGISLALGIPILSIATLLIGSTIGTGIFSLTFFLALTGFLCRKSIGKWVRHLARLKTIISGKYGTAIAVIAALIFVMHFVTALAPPTMFDTLVYHFTLPQAYLQTGKIQYVPDNMFWGMPQTTEMLYLLAMRFAGMESATLVSLFIGLTAMLGMAGYITNRFGKIAAWTGIAAILAGETLTAALSSGYIEWTVLLLGWAIFASFNYWLETRNRNDLILCGALCGAAIGTKYTAGIVLLGIMVALIFLPVLQTWKQRISNALLVGIFAVLFSLPWWIKNAVFTGNPFYPFFFPAGAMNEFRLFNYQHVPIWGNWSSVILLPWQATFWGVEAKDGFSASIGAILVGLSPLVWIGWKSRTEAQRNNIKTALLIVFVGFVVWAIGSRVSGLLIQSRLFFGIFPAWALLAGVGMDSIWYLRAANIRFGRVASALTLLMLGFNLFATWTGFIVRDPLAYVIRQEDDQGYLARNLGMYAVTMKTIQSLPADSRVLMLWETRGLACWPKCDADEVIDRWYDDVNTFQTPEKILASWQEKGYTHLLLNQAGVDFVRPREPRLTTEDWEKFETLLTRLGPPTILGSYALYPLQTSP